MANDLNENRRRAEELQREANDAVIALVKTDLDTGFTFAEIALESNSDAEKRMRNQAHARQAYDTVLYFLARTNPNPAALQELEAGFES